MVKHVLIKSGNHNVDLHTNGILNPKKIIITLHGFNGDVYGNGFSKLRKAYDDSVMVCSFNSAGHGESEVASIDMRMDLINRELFDVLTYLTKTYKDVPITLMATSYGGYRTMTTLSHYGLPNVKNIVFINPAFKMLDVLQYIRDFNYNDLKENDVIPMTSDYSKFLSKKFLDDLFENDVYKLSYEHIPTTIFVGTRDSLIPRQTILDFAKIYDCELIYIDDEHSLEDINNWQMIINYIGKLQ